MLCLDTSFLVDYLHGREHALTFLEARPHAEYVVPTVALWELYAGAERSDKKGDSITAIDQSLEWVEVIGFRRDTARESARIRARLFEQGTQINAVDILIAGVALDYGADLVAMDRDFDTIDGLNVLHPGDLNPDK